MTDPVARVDRSAPIDAFADLPDGVYRDGTVEVDVTRQTLDDGEEQLTVVITDDGVGLPAGFRPSLAGLGTRIVTSLASDLKGRIRWENHLPHGTRVEFVARLRPLGR